MHKTFSLLFCVTLLFSGVVAGAEEELTDQQVREILVRQSVSTFSGICPCPYSTDRAGRRCGSRSAYSKEEAADLLCFPRDVSDYMIERYRERQDEKEDENDSKSAENTD